MRPRLQFLNTITATRTYNEVSVRCLPFLFKKASCNAAKNKADISNDSVN